ncbi:unnamed protein product [Effrenium voratum]|uniref:Major facilitator superfamily (MFS) profile domain-containing protein n=1 Tax=Effrenium voratum TaxID=2562239 RepID=A0AA36I0A8_9DINO|nr:unnamed protein product [Effrenium voratum]
MTDFIVAPVSEGSIESIQSIQSEADPKGQALGKGHTGHTYWEFSKAFLKLTWPLLLGNTLEWYEFGIYSYVEKEIAANFFGGSAMGAWLGYAVTFVARPLGGIILGFIGDHCGRKLAVNLSLAGMVFATVGQGLLPGAHLGKNFQVLGLVLLICLRAVQGISAGGEIAAIAAYMMEVSPMQTLGMAVCMISVGSQIAWAFASALMALLNSCLGPELMLTWGWRVPFLLSAIAMWGRNRIQESEVFIDEVESDTKSVCSVGELVRNHPGSLLVGIGAVAATATMWFSPPFWTLSALMSDLGAADALWVGNSCQLVGLAVTPLAGLLADYFGVAWVQLVGALYCALVSFPTYVWLSFDASRLAAYLGVGIIFGVAQGFNGATVYLFCAELFPPKLRCQGMALSYNLGVSFLGGFSASISQALLEVSYHYGPGIYWSASGVVASCTILLALLLQRKGWIKLTHRRSAPYFGRRGRSVQDQLAI